MDQMKWYLLFLLITIVTSSEVIKLELDQIDYYTNVISSYGPSNGEIISKYPINVVFSSYNCKNTTYCSMNYNYKCSTLYNEKFEVSSNYYPIVEYWM